MSEHVSDNLAVAEEPENVLAEIQATADQAFAAKLSRRSPPNEVERGMSRSMLKLEGRRCSP